MIFIILLILFTFIILIINIQIPWTGDINWKIVDWFKNYIIKKKHHYSIKKLNKKIMRENLELISKILNESGIKFWLSEGTALGARRDGDFISHDDDLDLGIWYSDYNNFKYIILPLLKNKGFNLDFQSEDGTFIGLSRKHEKVDIDFTGKNIKCMSCTTKRANCKNCNELLKYLKNMSKIKFLGNEYLCPDTDYLEYLYGPDWKTPRKEKFTN
jgi:lipopolysaccharide cholinephosphotransferase